jgi:hypothetical protein
MRFWVLAVLSSMGAYGCSSLTVEQAAYTVQAKDGNFELRRYPRRVVAETYVDGEFDDVGNEGFRRLYAYIAGDNRTKSSIAMTAPVVQEKTSEEIAMTAPVTQEAADGRYRITFVMPAAYTLETLPEPADERVRLREEAERWVATVRYGGTWRRSRYLEHEKRLRRWVAQRELQPTGEPPVWARYDPPFMPWFWRRNEVLVPVEPPR